MMRRALFLLLVLASPASALPRPVSAYVDRVEGCNHWAGEEPYDKARAADIAKALKDGRCSTVERDGRALRRRYRHDAAALKALRDAQPAY